MNIGNLNIVSWDRDQHIRVHEMDATQFNCKEFEKSTLKMKEEDDLPNMHLISKQNPTSALQLYSNTTNSSRKSSFSEYTAYGTPPTNLNSILNNKTLIERDTSFTQNDDQSDMPYVRNPHTNSISISNTHNLPNLLKSSSSTLSAHEFLKKYPKCFGAKFSGLPGFIKFHVCLQN